MTDTETPSEIDALITHADEERLTDWLVDALHAVVGACRHHPGRVADIVLDVIRYELTSMDPDA